MSEYSSDAFSDPIRRMSDGALLRLAMIDKDELGSMRAGDTYFTQIKGRRDEVAYRETSFETIKRAFIIDNIADTVVQEDTLAPHLRGILGGMIVALADTHDLSQSRDVTPLMVDQAHAEKIVSDTWLFSTGNRLNREPFRLYSLDVGTVAITSVFFDHIPGHNIWRLGYENRAPKITYRGQPGLGDIEIVE